MNTDQFKQAIAKLPRPATDKTAPYWEYWRMVLYDWILANDPARFWECPAVFHCMLVNHWPFQIDYELSQLDLTRWQYALQIPHFGPDDYASSTRYSMNLIHQAYHLTQWERATGKRIEVLDTIVEFGGGYGAMALLCKRMGFEGRYVIYDLPEFSLLQEYYLSQFGMLNGVEWNPLHNPKPQDIDLYMGLYSLSEIPIEDRASGQQPLFAKSYLFLYSGQWQEYDNVNWFQRRWPNLASEFGTRVENWQHTEISHLPDKWNFYSIGF